MGEEPEVGRPILKIGEEPEVRRPIPKMSEEPEVRRLILKMGEEPEGQYSKWVKSLKARRPKHQKGNEPKG